MESWLQTNYGAQLHREPGFWNNPQFNQTAQSVVGVSWYEARAYCRWLAAQSGRNFRLPTEAEWEAAARGAKGRRYPWGETFEPHRANTYESHPRRTNPVGVFPGGATPGDAPIDDLGGNVWEWTASLNRNYPIKPGDGRDEQTDPGTRVIRGGAWDGHPDFARAAYRNNLIGFRLVCSPTSRWSANPAKNSVALPRIRSHYGRSGASAHRLDGAGVSRSHRTRGRANTKDRPGLGTMLRPAV